MRKSTIAAIVIACLLAFCLTSCQSASGKLVPVKRDLKARAYRIWQSTMDYQWRRDIGIHFVEVNPLTRVGDTLKLDDNQYYVITLIDTTKGGGR